MSGINSNKKQKVKKTSKKTIKDGVLGKKTLGQYDLQKYCEPDIHTTDQTNLQKALYEALLKKCELEKYDEFQISKKILSFDVGIKNLAYCLMEIDDNTKKFRINDWGIINLADNRSTCSFIKREGQFCNKIAKRKVKIDKHNTYYYCKDHISKASLKVQPIDIRWWNTDQDDITNCNMCKKPGLFHTNVTDGIYCKTHQNSVMSNRGFVCAAKKCKQIITNGLYVYRPEYDEYGIEDGDCYLELELGWCDYHLDTEYKAFIKKKTKKISQNSNKIPLSYLGESLYRQLDQKPNFLKVDDVLVENQPSFINPTMKSVSAMLLSYFIMKGVHEKEKTQSTIKNINFCSPSNKIKVGGEDANKKIKAEKIKSNMYKITKGLGVTFCKALISDNDDALKMLDLHKKQDDMADAFLQGFITHFGKALPLHYTEMINGIKYKNQDQTKVKIKKTTKIKKSKKIIDDLEEDEVTIKIGKKDPIKKNKKTLNKD